LPTYSTGSRGATVVVVVVVSAAGEEVVDAEASVEVVDAIVVVVVTDTAVCSPLPPHDTAARARTVSKEKRRRIEDIQMISTSVA
jgi:hypothetical protein